MSAYGNRGAAAGLLLAAWLLTLGGCANIPAESVALNQEVGRGIAESRERHVNLVNVYFRAKSEQVDDWIENRYLAEYLRNIQAELKKAGQSTVLTPEQLRDVLKDVIAERDQKQADLEKTRVLLLERIETHYAGLVQANAAVTALLQSAVSVRESQGRAVGTLSGGRVDLDVVEQKFSGYLTKAGAAADKATSLYENVKKALDKRGD